jgi:alpha-glucosidase
VSVAIGRDPGATIGGTEASPRADPASIVVSGQARFTVLTAALLRLEWSASGRFEDGASQIFVNRRLPPVSFDVRREDPETLSIRTEALRLTWRDEGRPFDERTLRVEVGGIEPPVVWAPGTKPRGNLLGTVRTLDRVSGSCPLPPGLLSRDGWSVVDDSRSLVFEEYPDGWIRQRADPGALDLYFFGHGRDYTRALRDFVAVAGRIPMPPRWALGCWWSRYWPYSEGDFRALVGEFERHGVPLDVLCVDMDWHSKGWTGYTWDPRHFPDPARFLRWARSSGLRVVLNLHPAEGVGDHEERFEEMARALGLDPAQTRRIPFDCTDRRFMKAYFEVLHHPLEKQGVDFWWIDWQQGTESTLPGLDPLWWLNHLHCTDATRSAHRGGRRPLLLSRYGGPGCHRYPLGFSGDTYSNWESLSFQPRFTATASNVGFAWWSHDIGGHYPGPVEGELYVRWIQWGAFSPILRTHATRHPQAERRIWAFDDRIFRASRDAMRLRAALVPYIYTAARRTHDTGVGVCRPMYYAFPHDDRAYRCPGQYMFGEDLIVAPVTRPVDPGTGLADVDLWVPPGAWVDLFTGRVVSGPRDLSLRATLEEMPVLVRAGAPLPMAPPGLRCGDGPPTVLQVHVFAGTGGASEVYDDDGVTSGYEHGAYTLTPLRFSREEGRRVVEIGPASGGFGGMGRSRIWSIHLRDTPPARHVLVNGAPLRRRDRHPRGSGSWHYDERALANVLWPGEVAVDASLRVEFEIDQDPAVESLLRRGLRGCMRRLEALAEALPEDGPEELAEVPQWRRDLAEAPGEVVMRLASLRAHWPALRAALGSLDAAAAAAEDALRRVEED